MRNSERSAKAKRLAKEAEKTAEKQSVIDVDMLTPVRAAILANDRHGAQAALRGLLFSKSGIKAWQEALTHDGLKAQVMLLVGMFREVTFTTKVDTALVHIVTHQLWINPMFFLRTLQSWGDFLFLLLHEKEHAQAHMLYGRVVHFGEAQHGVRNYIEDIWANAKARRYLRPQYDLSKRYYADPPADNAEAQDSWKKSLRASRGMTLALRGDYKLWRKYLDDNGLLRSIEASIRKEKLEGNEYLAGVNNFDDWWGVFLNVLTVSPNYEKFIGIMAPWRGVGFSEEQPPLLGDEPKEPEKKMPLGNEPPPTPEEEAQDDAPTADGGDEKGETDDSGSADDEEDEEDSSEEDPEAAGDAEEDVDSDDSEEDGDDAEEEDGEDDGDGEGDDDGEGDGEGDAEEADDEAGTSKGGKSDGDEEEEDDEVEDVDGTDGSDGTDGGDDADDSEDGDDASEEDDAEGDEGEDREREGDEENEEEGDEEDEGEGEGEVGPPKTTDEAEPKSYQEWDDDVEVPPNPAHDNADKEDGIAKDIGPYSPPKMEELAQPVSGLGGYVFTHVQIPQNDPDNLTPEDQMLLDLAQATGEAKVDAFDFARRIIAHVEQTVIGSVLAARHPTEHTRQTLFPSITRRSLVMLGSGHLPTMYEYHVEEAPPLMDVFVDVSGSMNRYYVLISRVAKMLAGHVGKVIQFSTDMVVVDPQDNGLYTTGGTDYNIVARQIIESGATEVVILTDNDAKIHPALLQQLGNQLRRLILISTQKAYGGKLEGFDYLVEHAAEFPSLQAEEVLLPDH